VHAGVADRRDLDVVKSVSADRIEAEKGEEQARIYYPPCVRHLP